MRRMWMKMAAVTLCSVWSLASNAQSNDDFGLDFGIGAEKKLCKGLDVDAELNARTQDDTGAWERIGGGVALSYKILNTKNFDMKASAGWEFIRQHKLAERENKYDMIQNPNGTSVQGDYKGYNMTDGYWRNRMRESVGLSASYKPNKRWSFSLKETLQMNQYGSVDSIHTEKWRFNNDDDLYKVDGKKEKGRTDKTVLRSKCTVQYDIRHSMFAPYASVDYGRGINYNASKWKLTAGTDVKLNKTNKVTLFYRFQTENDDDEANGHILGVNYSIKL